MSTSESVRSLIDKYFSLQWCKDNLVVPLEVNPSLSSRPDKIKIVIGNIQYLGTIGNIIKDRVKPLECSFEERLPEEINELLDRAANEQVRDIN